MYDVSFAALFSNFSCQFCNKLLTVRNSHDIIPGSTERKVVIPTWKGSALRGYIHLGYSCVLKGGYGPQPPPPPTWIHEVFESILEAGFTNIDPNAPCTGQIMDESDVSDTAREEYAAAKEVVRKIGRQWTLLTSRPINARSSKKVP
jgi:hypothetical protein